MSDDFFEDAMDNLEIIQKQAERITELEKALLEFKRQYPNSPWIHNQVEDACPEQVYIDPRCGVVL